MEKIDIVIPQVHKIELWFKQKFEGVEISFFLIRPKDLGIKDMEIDHFLEILKTNKLEYFSREKYPDPLHLPSLLPDVSCNCRLIVFPEDRSWEKYQDEDDGKEYFVKKFKSSKFSGGTTSPKTRTYSKPVNAKVVYKEKKDESRLDVVNPMEWYLVCRTSSHKPTS